MINLHQYYNLHLSSKHPCLHSSFLPCWCILILGSFMTGSWKPRFSKSKGAHTVGNTLCISQMLGGSWFDLERKDRLLSISPRRTIIFAKYFLGINLNVKRFFSSFYFLWYFHFLCYMLALSSLSFASFGPDNSSVHAHILITIPTPMSKAQTWRDGFMCHLI